MTQHKATPEQWNYQEQAEFECDATASCLLELRDRIAAKEAQRETEKACIQEIYEKLDRLKVQHESNWSRIVKLEEAHQQPEPIDEEENSRRFWACLNAIENATPEQTQTAVAKASAKLDPQAPAPTGGLVERVAKVIADSDSPVDLWYPDARAALAQPEPVGPTDEEPASLPLADLAWPDPTTITPRGMAINGRMYRLEPMDAPEPTDEEWEALKERVWNHYRTVGYQGELFIYDRDFDTALDDVRRELARWGRPAIEPEPVGPTDAAKRVIHYLAQRQMLKGLEPEIIHALHAGTDEPRQATLTVSDLTALARYGRPTLTPIPVSERLPGVEDLDAEGTCWMWHPVNFHYCLCLPDPSVHTHWLPAHALPLPTGDDE